MLECAILSMVGIISIVCASYIVEYLLHWLKINNSTYKPIQLRKSYRDADLNDAEVKIL